MEIYKKLLKVQRELKAPKTQYNSFGKYKYRNAEDILEAVKPIAHAEGCIVLCSDDVEIIGEHYYVKATAMLIDADGDGKVCATAFAREEDEKKGMDASQITGSTSSYARKYALNGLFAIDDNADSDTTNSGTTEQQQPKQTAKRAPAKKQLTEEECKKWAVWEAKGQKSKDDGRSAREVFLERFYVSEEQLNYFDDMVDTFRKAMNVQ